MTVINTTISNFIEAQFPAFYRSEGPNFVAFIKAYYEWLEQEGSALGEARRLFDLKDIDRTREEFFEYFKRQFVAGIPANIAADERLLVKYITDLYRSKGTKRGYELLFRLVFNEDIEVFIPSEVIFKASDNEWKVPRYIEVTSVPNLERLISREIRTIGNTGRAVVESFERKIISSRTVNILELSNLIGQFRSGEQITTVASGILEPNRLPIITGSLTAVSISDGGFNFKVGDLVNITGSGINGKARVTKITNDFNGSVRFSIINGGTGYTVNSVVTVQTTLNLPSVNLVGQFAPGEQVLDSSSGANGIIVQANSTVLELVQFGAANNFQIGAQLVGQTSSASANILRVLGGQGAGASFRVGSIINKELITLNTEVILNNLLIPLESSNNTFLLDINNVIGSFSDGDTITNEANVAILEALSISPNFVSKGEVLSNTSLGISDLYCFRADQNRFWVTGPDAQLENSNLVPGVILSSNISVSSIQLVNTPTKETYNTVGVIEQSNSSTFTVSSNGYFVQSTTLINANTAGTANTVQVTRFTNWSFANSFAIIDNLDAQINQVAPFALFEIGTIATLSAINPGSGYLTRPFVSVVEPLVAELNRVDPDGTIQGRNAIIGTNVVSGNGVVTAVDVFDSGYGYLDNETVILTSNTADTNIIGSAIIYDAGKGEGRWLNRRSFPSDLMKLFDGRFYQDYSYELITSRMLSTYESLVREMVHPAGLALYGRYRINRVIDQEESTISTELIEQ